jgi:hypothetical protein
MTTGGGRSGSKAHDVLNGSTRRIDPEETRPMSRSSEFVHLAVLSAIFIGVAMLSRFI